MMAEKYNLFITVLAETTPTNQIIDPLTVMFCMLGVGLLAFWQIREPLLGSLNRCPIRRNRLPLFFPFFQLFVWLVAAGLLNEILRKILFSRPEHTIQFVQSLVLAAMEIAMAALFVLTARFAFVRGLKGFGLRFRTVGKDIFWAGVNLVAIYPVILLSLWLTIQAGQWFVGPEFDLQKHQTLVELNQAGPMWMKIGLIFSVVAVAPIFEELLFRGLLQSVLTAYLAKPWLSIGITSLLFASLHYGTHFFGIFALSCCLGYAYEKSGSLLRPIFIHVFFNASSVLAVLLFGAK
jgi:membrane protease YdiL (CAAX protease family)